VTSRNPATGTARSAATLTERGEHAEENTMPEIQETSGRLAGSPALPGDRVTDRDETRPAGSEGGTTEGVSEQHVEGRIGDPAVKARPEARQSVDVKPMRYVLGLGILLSAIGMFLAYLLFV
jgi:hypothetical protein